MAGVRQCGMQTGKRTREAGDQVSDYRIAERLVDGGVLIGVDQQLFDLGRETFCDPLDERLAVQQLQALVDSAHAAGQATGKNHPGDRFARRPRISV